MSALYDMKAFFRFLDEANDSELAEKENRLMVFIENAQDDSIRNDARYLLKQIEQERLSRISSSNY